MAKMMKTEHPIIFTGEMVRAILDLRKTVTRRVIKPQPSSPWDKPPQWIDTDGFYHSGEGSFLGTKSDCRCPYGKVGDRLWVREAMECVREIHVGKEFYGDEPYDCYYDAYYTADHVGWNDLDLDESPLHDEWFENYRNWYEAHDKGVTIPSIHMPRWASRITLEITNIRVQRVQDISEDDAVAEGILNEGGIHLSHCHYHIFHPDQQCSCGDKSLPKHFASLWDSINSKPKPVYRTIDGKRVITHYVSYPWEDIQETREYCHKPWYVYGNSWVWAIGFKMPEKESG